MQSRQPVAQSRVNNSNNKKRMFVRSRCQQSQSKRIVRARQMLKFNESNEEGEMSACSGRSVAVMDLIPPLKCAAHPKA